MNRQYGALSGFAIGLIVLNHAIHFGLQMGRVDGVWHSILVVLQALGGFAVPIFLFVSGAFLAYAAREFSTAFVRGSLQRIVLPYMVWSLIFFALLYAVTGERDPWTGYLRHLVVGYPYHFVPLLVFWYVTAPIVAGIGRRHGVVLLAGLAAWQAWLLAVRAPEMFGLEGVIGPWAARTLPPVVSTSMSEWGVYFPLGLVMSLHAQALKPRLLGWRHVNVAATATLFALGMANGLGWIHAPWARLLAPAPLMFVLPTIDRAAIPFLSLFEWLGRRSYGIYLAHFVVLNILLVAIGAWAPHLKEVPLLIFPAFFAAALGFPLALMEAFAKSPRGRRMFRHVFGIVPPPPSVLRRG